MADISRFSPIFGVESKLGLDATFSDDFFWRNHLPTFGHRPFLRDLVPAAQSILDDEVALMRKASGFVHVADVAVLLVVGSSVEQMMMLDSALHTGWLADPFADPMVVPPPMALLDYTIAASHPPAPLAGKGVCETLFEAQGTSHSSKMLRCMVAWTADQIGCLVWWDEDLVPQNKEKCTSLV